VGGSAGSANISALSGSGEWGDGRGLGPLKSLRNSVFSGFSEHQRPQRFQVLSVLSGSNSAKFSVPSDAKEIPMTKQYVREEYPLSEETGKIIKAAKEVHKELGPGFEEVIYQRALALEFPTHGLDFSREVWIDVHYKGAKVGRKRVDFIVDEVLVEIKAKAALEDVDFVQTLSYLKASGYKVALLLNFGAKQLEIKRIVYEKGRH
jgi:GxxExxY protein